MGGGGLGFLLGGFQGSCGGHGEDAIGIADSIAPASSSAFDVVVETADDVAVGGVIEVGCLKFGDLVFQEGLVRWWGGY